MGVSPGNGELLVLGVKVAASTVWEILQEAGIDPAPERSSATWAGFLRSQAEALLGAAETSQETRRERTAPPATPVRDTEPPDDDEPPTSPPSLRLAPLLGEARGGSLRGVGQAGEEQIPVPPQYSRHNDVFAIKVNGNSMKGYGVLDGDFVTILPQDKYQDGIWSSLSSGVSPLPKR